MDLRTYEELNNQEKMVQKLERIEGAIRDLKHYFKETQEVVVRCSSRNANEEILKVLRNIFYVLLFIGGWLCVLGTR